MHTSIGKPLVALVSAACLSIPATIPALNDRISHGALESSMAVQLSAAVTSFDPVPPSVRSLPTSVAPAGDAKLVAAVGQMAELSGVDTGTLLLQLLTAPYHNVLAVSIAAGKAANAVLQYVSLPFSVATFVLTNRTTEIPAYIATVKSNLAGALPGIQSAIKSEIAYDKDVIAQIFGGSGDTASASVSADAAVQAAAVSPNVVLQLLAAPYHNVLAVGMATGKAVNAGLQYVSLPFSVATFVLTNRTTEIPAYIATVKSNLAGALPAIQSTIKSEIAYDKDLIKQVFGGPSSTANVVADTAATTPNLLASSHRLAVDDTSSDDTADAATTAETAKPVKPAGPKHALKLAWGRKTDTTTTKSDTTKTTKTGGKHRKPHTTSDAA